jgi:hypothetical protein
MCQDDYFNIPAWQKLSERNDSRSDEHPVTIWTLGKVSGVKTFTYYYYTIDAINYCYNRDDLYTHPTKQFKLVLELSILGIHTRQHFLQMFASQNTQADGIAFLCKHTQDGVRICLVNKACPVTGI